MNIVINGTPRRVNLGDFNYSNIESEYGVNTQYFTKNGKPFTPIAGEMHFARVPRERWHESLLKMRECGINVVSNYVFWNYHEEEKNVFDFNGNKDIAAFLQICKDIDMPCILRIGPWCHGEVIRGGFPKRINRMVGKRSNNPQYLDEVREFWQGLYKEVKPYLFINGKAYFLEGTVYCDNGKIYCEKTTDIDLKNEISLTKTAVQPLPYNYFMHSTGRRSYYKLKLPENILNDRFDVVLEFDFDGLNLQVFSGKQIVNDYFNIDRKFVMNLRDYKKYIEKNGEMIIRTAPKTKFGISNVYSEIEIPLHSDKLTLISAKVVALTEV